MRMHSATVLKSLSKLSEYLNAIERLKTYYPNQIIVHNPTSLSYLYRGLENKEYELLPGLFRKQQDIFDDEGHSVENYQYLAFGTFYSHLFMKRATIYNYQQQIIAAGRSTHSTMVFQQGFWIGAEIR